MTAKKNNFKGILKVNFKGVCKNVSLPAVEVLKVGLTHPEDGSKSGSTPAQDWKRPDVLCTCESAMLNPEPEFEQRVKRGALTEQKEYATLLCQFSTGLLTCQLLAIAVVCEVVGQLETAIDTLGEHKWPPVVAEALRLQQNSSVHLLQLQQKH